MGIQVSPYPGYGAIKALRAPLTRIAGEGPGVRAANGSRGLALSRRPCRRSVVVDVRFFAVFALLVRQGIVVAVGQDAVAWR